MVIHSIHPAAEGVVGGRVEEVGGGEVGCPLCGRTGRQMRKGKPLYGVKVCRKCYYGFINRRQGAFVIDRVLWWLITAFIWGVANAVLAVVGVLPQSQPGQMSAGMVLWVGVYLGVSYVVFPLIFCFKDGIEGYTLRRLIFGVPVIDQRTREGIGFVASLKRNLILVIPFSSLVVAFLLGKGYRVGDRWAGTRVVWRRYAEHRVFGGGLVCERCQYNLIGNTTGRCPECGTLVSEANLVMLSEVASGVRVGSNDGGLP